MSALVSVLIPAYNHEAYIQEAIKSIIAQSYDAIELLIIDDGSQDCTVQKIEELSKVCHKRFVRFHYHTQNNAGVIVTLNNLISQSSGGYLYVIASDDMAKPDAIAKQVKFLQENQEYALVVGDNEIIDDKSRVAYWDKKQNLVYEKTQAKYITFGAALKCKKRGSLFGSYLDLYTGNNVPNGYLIRKSILEKTGLYKTQAPLEDWYMNLQIAKYAKIKYLDDVLFSYRWHGANTVKQRDRMEKNTALTFEYENKLLCSLAPDALTQDMRDCLEYGKQRRKLVIVPQYLELRSIRNTNKRKWLLRVWKLDIVF